MSCASNEQIAAANMKRSLVAFVKRQTGLDVESVIDDILVTYLLAMVDPQMMDPDDFDVDGLREMLAAYVPEVDQITDGQLAQWVADTSSSLASSGEELPSPPESMVSFRPIEPVVSQIHQSGLKSRREQPSSQSNRYTHDTEIKAKGKIDDIRVDELALEALAEMFPHKNALRIRKSLLITNGDVDAAAQLLLQDDGVAMGGDELLLSSTQMAAQRAHVDEKTLRDQIINRYAYVDVDEDKKEHKPVVPKAEPKKLIRYRDNKVVSVKGERFTIEKKSQEIEN
ncbi:CUE domain-containing protein 2-like [Tropilaelaps mercedesae]|uniref:CUE domain-containing protein 2-like n=1 Tax=Tropilaelaps mercedesae TaxID=418985 RepID=A0A1V9X3N3_9ACAR|nr:CUE domain-containing protein 2-like [Tropilaelaps mercedesae]